MKINNDLIPNIIKTSETTSDIYGYSCSYLNDKFKKMNILSTWNYTNSAINVNDCTESGLYFFDVGARNSTNAPTTWNTSKLLLIINCSYGTGSSGVLQIWFDTYSQDRNPRFRMCTWGTWEAWKKINLA